MFSLSLLLSLLCLVSSRSLRSTMETSKDSTCSFQSDNYSLSWSYDELSSDVVFKLSTHSKFDNFWSGVYMGKDEPTDAIGVFVRSGQIGLVDGHVTGEREIEADSLTNVQSLAFDLQSGHLTAEFARPLSPQDKTDADLADCVTFFFPVSAQQIDVGGPVEVGEKMEKKRVCDLAASCVARDQPTAELVKRADTPVCEYANEKSALKWRQEGENLVFAMEIPAKKGKWWSAIGVGENMQDLSMMVAFTENGKLKHSSGFRSTGYGPPQQEDGVAPQLNVLSSTVANGKASMEFSVGKEMLDGYVNEGCFTLQIAILAGHYGNDFSVHKHEETPIAIPVCGIEQCAGAVEEKKGEETVVEAEKTEEQEGGEGEEDDGPAAMIAARHPKKGKKAAEKEKEEDDEKEEKKEEEEQIRGDDPIVAEDVKEGSGGIAEGGESVQTVKTVEIVPNGVTQEEKTGGSVAGGETQTEKREEGSGGAETQSVEGSGLFDAAVKAVDEMEEGSGVAPIASPSTPSTTQEETANETLTGSSSNDIREKDTPVVDNSLVPSVEVDHNEVSTTTTVAAEMKAVDGMTGSSEAVKVDGEAEAGKSSTVSSIGADQNTTEGAEGPTEEELATGQVHTLRPPLGLGEEAGATVTNAQGTEGAVPANVDGTVQLPITIPEVCEQDDLRVCEGYFNDYLKKVEQWSDKHSQTVTSQMWKACKLLSEVKHVTTMCCHRFKKECGSIGK